MKSQLLSVFPILLQRPLFFKPAQTVLKSVTQHFEIAHTAIDFCPAWGFLQHISEVFFRFFEPFRTSQINTIACSPTRSIGSADETALHNIQQFTSEIVTPLIDVTINQA